MRRCAIDFSEDPAETHQMRGSLVLLILPLIFSGCIQTEHRVETHHTIEPIHITVDVNLKVDRELNDFFGDLDEDSGLIEYEEPTAE